jgi:cell division protein FtsN
LEAAATEESLLSGPAESATSGTDEDIESAQLHLEQEKKFQQDLELSQSTDESTYGFYDSLQASSWRVPVQRGVYLTEEDRKRANYRYILQAASLRSRTEALALVAKLRKLGMDASYSESGAGISKWYRVNVGPFSNVSVMNKAEDTLVAMRMMPLKRRVQ